MSKYYILWPMSATEPHDDPNKKDAVRLKSSPGGVEYASDYFFSRLEAQHGMMRMIRERLRLREAMERQSYGVFLDVSDGSGWGYKLLWTFEGSPI